MNRSQIFSAVSISASALAVWIFIVTQVQPDKNDPLIISTFFLSLAVWLGSLLAAIIYTMKVRKNNREVIYAHIRPSIRQGLLIATSLSTLLFLQMIRVLSVWDAILVIFIVILFELALRQNDPMTKA
ncbi:MAG TPA: hypothetical protein VGE59_05105 [Patescibacteria group bacterium]